MKNPILSLDGTPASRFAFGTMQFGGRADERQSREMFESCIAAGITHFDTAHIYTKGASEEFLGRFAAPHRERLIIASKCAYDKGATALNIRASLETSRQRMNIDSIDILYLHRFDPHTDLAETMGCFAELKQQGLIRYVGLSNFAAWQVMKAAAAAAKFDLRIDILQPMYNLVKRQAEVEILPMAESENFWVAPYSPLGGGLLSGKYTDGGGTGRLTEDDKYNTRYGQEYMHAAAAGLTRIAQETGIHPATLAVAWVAAHQQSPVPIVSARTAEQLAPSLAALDMRMDDAVYARLSALSRTPPPATDRTEEA